MANNKHLTLDNRSTIELMLNRKASFRAIADALDKDPSTISKEIRSHLVFRRVLSESHSGISLSEAEIRHLDEIVFFRSQSLIQ